MKHRHALSSILMAVHADPHTHLHMRTHTQTHTFHNACKWIRQDQGECRKTLSFCPRQKKLPAQRLLSCLPARRAPQNLRPSTVTPSCSFQACRLFRYRTMNSDTRHCLVLHTEEGAYSRLAGLRRGFSFRALAWPRRRSPCSCLNAQFEFENPLARQKSLC